MADVRPSRAYRILGLSPSAGAEDVKAAYRDLAQVWHPDRFPDNPRLREKAARNLQRINDAYAVLKDYTPPSGPLPPLPRDSISAMLGLGDLRDSAAFRVPVATLRRSLRILGITANTYGPRPRRRTWWLVALVLGASIVALVAALMP